MTGPRIPSVELQCGDSESSDGETDDTNIARSDQHPPSASMKPFAPAEGPVFPPGLAQAAPEPSTDIQADPLQGIGAIFVIPEEDISDEESVSDVPDHQPNCRLNRVLTMSDASLRTRKVVRELLRNPWDSTDTLASVT